MRKNLVMAVLAATVVLSGCSSSAGTSDESTVFEKVDQEGQAGSDAEGTSDQAASGEAAQDESAGSETAADASAAEDYTDEIKAEIEKTASDSASLREELVSVNSLYDKYDELRMNAETQTEINELSQWGTLVWKEEVSSLLSRIKENNPEGFDNINSEYEKWVQHVPFMAEKMSYVYEGGSIYPTIYAYNEAMRYKQEAYGLASTLADLVKDPDFGFPDYTRCGFYGDYTGDSYLVITEGMENGSYNILIHFDDTKEVRGWGEVEDAPDSDTYLLFTSDDETLKGYVAHDNLEASFYVTETDYSVVGPEGAWTFSFKY